MFPLPTLQIENVESYLGHLGSLGTYGLADGSALARSQASVHACMLRTLCEHALVRYHLV